MRISNKEIAGLLRDAAEANNLSRYPSQSEAPGPCKLVARSFNSVESANRTQIGELPHGVHQNNSKAFIFQPLRVTEEQRKRMVYRYNELGHSIRKISREEGRARQTVTRIVRTAPETLAAERELKRLKNEFRSMWPKVIKSWERALEKDWRVAARYFDLMGISEQRKRR